MHNYVTNETSHCDMNEVINLNHPGALNNGRRGRSIAGFFGLLDARPSYLDHLKTDLLEINEIEPTLRNTHILDVGSGMSSAAYEFKRLNISYTAVDPMYCNEWTQFELQNEVKRSEVSIRKSLKFLSNKTSIAAEYMHAIETQVERNPISSYSDAGHLFFSDYMADRDRYRCGALPQSIPQINGPCSIALVSNFLLFREHNVSFVIAAMNTLLEQCDEVRIHPIVDYYGRNSSALNDVLDYYSHANDYNTTLKNASYYEFNSSATLSVKKINVGQCAIDNEPSPTIKLSK